MDIMANSQENLKVGRELMLIDGQWVGSTNGEFISVENPSRRGTIVGEVPRAKGEDVDRAVKAAAKAFEKWRRVSPRDRGKLMIKMGEIIQEKADEIARITTLETGNAMAQEPYRGPTLSKQLEEQGRKFLADQQKGFRIDREKKIVYLSQVFKFDKKHFDTLGGGALNFILPFLHPEDRGFVKKEKLNIEFLGYNWKSNDIRNAR